MTIVLPLYDGIVDGSKRLSEERQTDTRGWLVGATSFGFILLQSLCTTVIAVSGVRVVIGLGSLVAAAGVGAEARWWHQDAIRIPMMLVAVVGSVANLYVIWRVRTLRARPSSQWRMAPVPKKKIWSENLQIVLAAVSLVMVAVEGWLHWSMHRT